MSLDDPGEAGQSLIPVEVKATDRPRPRDWSNLVEFRNRHGEKVKGGILLHAGRQMDWVSERILTVPWWRVI